MGDGGLAAILGGRLFVSREIVKIDLPMLTSSAALVGLTALDGTISRIDGLLLFAGAVIYGVYGMRMSRPSPVTQAKVEAAVAEDLGLEHGRLRPLVPLVLFYILFLGMLFKLF